MKYIFLIFTLISSINLQAQENNTRSNNTISFENEGILIIDPPSDYYCSGFKVHSNFDYLNYDSTNQKMDFEKAFQAKTSLAEKIDLLNRVGFYNCKNEYGLHAAKFIDSLKNEYIKNIEHDWIWEASITEAYGIHKETPQTSGFQRVLSFRNDSMTIIQNDSIIYKSKLNYTELSSRENNHITLRIQPADILYENQGFSYFEVIFDTELDYFLGLPLELMEKENFYFLRVVRMGQHQPVEFYSRKMD